MKILWVCNIMLPVVAEHLGMEVNNKEGWLTGLADMILRNRENNQIELAVAFPVSEELQERKWSIPVQEGHSELMCYGFIEDTNHPEIYVPELETELKAIVDEFKPDVVHCFGTEYPHTLAITKVCDKKRVLIGIQGLCKLYAERYLADLPEKVINRVTFRDWLKKDSILQQEQKFIQRGKQEVEALLGTGHVTGRTWIDKDFAIRTNPEVQYHFMNETLRSNFYEGAWEYEKCEKHSIFLSQGDYPIKGLHYMLKAMPAILQVYPDAKVYVAGNKIASYETWKDKIKISSYGKYILELIKKNELQDKIIFLGRMNAAQMKEQFLKSHVFVCPSVIENSPNSLGEAMILGVPCVTARSGGIPSIFTDGEDGIAYPAYGASVYEKEEDKEQAQANRLAQAVMQMWADEEKMLAYTKSAARHARQTHNGQANYERLVEIYSSIAE